MPLQGETYIVGRGPAVAAGQTVAFTFTGCRITPSWPRNVALGLAVRDPRRRRWGSIRRGAAAPRATSGGGGCDARRDRLFAELTRSRNSIATGDRSRALRARRAELVAALERVYAELDEEAAA